MREMFKQTALSNCRIPVQGLTKCTNWEGYMRLSTPPENAQACLVPPGLTSAWWPILDLVGAETQSQLLQLMLWRWRAGKNETTASECSFVPVGSD